jgi:hypothetical protein
VCLHPPSPKPVPSSPHPSPIPLGRRTLRWWDDVNESETSSESFVSCPDTVSQSESSFFSCTDILDHMSLPDLSSLRLCNFDIISLHDQLSPLQVDIDSPHDISYSPIFSIPSDLKDHNLFDMWPLTQWVDQDSAPSPPLSILEAEARRVLYSDHPIPVSDPALQQWVSQAVDNMFSSPDISALLRSVLPWLDVLLQQLRSNEDQAEDRLYMLLHGESPYSVFDITNWGDEPEEEHEMVSAPPSHQVDTILPQAYMSAQQRNTLLHGFRPFATIPFSRRPAFLKPSPNLIAWQDRLLADNIIEPANKGHYHYLSQVFLIPEPKHCLIVNFSHLTAHLPRLRMRLPVFTKALKLVPLVPEDLMIQIDLKHAFYQIPVHPIARPLLRIQFYKQGPHFNMTRLPMGLSQSPAILQSIIRTIITSFQPKPKFSWVHLDDILIVSSPGWFHDHLQSFLNHLKQARLTINRDKSQLSPISKLTYCGLEINLLQLQVAPSKAKLERLL